MLDKLFGKLVFGWADCHNCGCLNPMAIRINFFSKKKCLCCGKVFRVTNENFHKK